MSQLNRIRKKKGKEFYLIIYLFKRIKKKFKIHKKVSKNKFFRLYLKKYIKVKCVLTSKLSG